MDINTSLSQQEILTIAAAHLYITSRPEPELFRPIVVKAAGGDGWAVADIERTIYVLTYAALHMRNELSDELQYGKKYRPGDKSLAAISNLQFIKALPLNLATREAKAAAAKCFDTLRAEIEHLKTSHGGELGCGGLENNFYKLVSF